MFGLSVTFEEPRMAATPMASIDRSARARQFEALYDAHFDFVYRSVRRLGLPESLAEDATQEVFMIVHRRLDDFDGTSTARTWIFGIAFNVVRNHRRQRMRRGEHETLSDEGPIDTTSSPAERAERAEAMRTLDRLLDTLDEDRRAVFVLAELEQMSATEIAEALGINANTVYSRLRAARQDFEAAARRYRRSAR
jgi:RNA polymerase sigma-70 factor (ECF subfamily)